MFILEAPYPNIQTTTLLPSPNWGDSIEPVAIVKALRAMDGTLYTYVKSKDQRKKHSWEFNISRDKALELEAFIRSYTSSKIKIVDHDNTIFIGYLQTNPSAFSGSGRAPSVPGGEYMSVSINFEESE
jgi:hypothetical protein